MTVMYIVAPSQKKSVILAARLWLGNAKALWLLALSRNDRKDEEKLAHISCLINRQKCWKLIQAEVSELILNCFYVKEYNIFV